jgi:hypothetical protein
MVRELEDAEEDGSRRGTDGVETSAEGAFRGLRGSLALGCFGPNARG